MMMTITMLPYDCVRRALRDRPSSAVKGVRLPWHRPSGVLDGADDESFTVLAFRSAPT
jgi:hypothetical protein